MDTVRFFLGGFGVLLLALSVSCGGDTQGSGAFAGTNSAAGAENIKIGVGGTTATIGATGGTGTTIGAGGKVGTAQGTTGAAGKTVSKAGAGGGAGKQANAGSGASGSDGTEAPTDTGPADFTKFKDPGKGAWEKGTPEECKMDPTKFADSSLNTYAVFRYGKMCHIKGADVVATMYSATKTLGGVMSGRAAYVAKDVKKTGPGTGPIVHTDLGTDWLGTATYPLRQATIAHIMAMVAGSTSMDALTFAYDTVGSTAINNMIAVSEKSFKQVPAYASLNAVSFVQQEIFDKLGMTNSTWPGGMIASGWTANMSDMGKLGTLMLHDGWYGGERLVSQEWMYRLSHPGFEEANTSYGQLAWLNHRGNAQGIGGDIASGSNSADGDPCAPACFWSKYPHPPSKATDCRATVAGASCEQKHDVGVYSAQGMFGQFVVMHPGLDLVIVAQNFSGGGGPMGMWAAVRPGIVAMDPKYKDDEAAFCKAYGAGDYAPDLVVPRWKP